MSKCTATTKKGTQCTRNKTVGNFCTQHGNVEQKTLETTEQALIPDLQQIVNQYITPYDYYKLITKNSKMYTITEYQKIQTQFEKSIALDLTTELKSESEIFLDQIKDELKEQKDEIIRLRNLGMVTNDVNLNFIRLKEREDFLWIYKSRLRAFILPYIQKIIQAFKDANIIDTTDLLTQGVTSDDIEGIQLSDFFGLHMRTKLRILYHDTRGFRSRSHFEVYKLLKAGPKNLYLDIYNTEELSPLWKAYIKIVETENDIWREIIRITGFDIYVAPR